MKYALTKMNMIRNMHQILTVDLDCSVQFIQLLNLLTPFNKAESSGTPRGPVSSGGWSFQVFGMRWSKAEPRNVSTLPIAMLARLMGAGLSKSAMYFCKHKQVKVNQSICQLNQCLVSSYCNSTLLLMLSVAVPSWFSVSFSLTLSISNDMIPSSCSDERCFIVLCGIRCSNLVERIQVSSLSLLIERRFNCSCSLDIFGCLSIVAQRIHSKSRWTRAPSRALFVGYRVSRCGIHSLFSQGSLKAVSSPSSELKVVMNS